MKTKLISTVLSALLALTLLFVLASCDSAPGTTTPGGDATATVTLNGDSITLSDETVGKIDGSNLTITKGGTYTVCGTLNNGQICVQVDKEANVTLILSGANITCANSAPIFVKSAKNCYIELAADTTNTITDGETYLYANALETEPSAAIFSKADLIIQGSGTLTVTANYNNAIASKDDLEIKGGTLNITAKNHGLKGKDSVVIKNGTLTLDVAGDGIKSDEDTDPAKGFVQIDGGTLKITAGDEGLQGKTNVLVNGGSIEINADSNGIKADIGITISSGTVTITCASDGLDSPANSGTATVNGQVMNY